MKLMNHLCLTELQEDSNNALITRSILNDVSHKF
jgi:hypothetical protein